jgi:hypothetical protein
MPPPRFLRCSCTVLLPASAVTSGGDEHALRAKSAELLRGDYVPGFGFLKHLVSISSAADRVAMRALHDGTGRVEWPLCVIGTWVHSKDELGSADTEVLFVPTPEELKAMPDDAARLASVQLLGIETLEAADGLAPLESEL